MMSLLGRLRALVLVLVFLGGGTSLPSLDVLFFHMHGETSHSTTHVESSDGDCATHVGHCGIGCPAGASGALAALAAAPWFGATPPRASSRPAITLPALAAWKLGFRSRAPPVSHA